ncbi:hypothetical protein [Halobacterium sp. CBA1126]|uniref:hypothetical protein n=1 Tax=Halobacterium sp. CBA1126 TaxID=2668074 RepID=UPI0012FA7345|nr:hypothetical protein [Halobacterium sp. CBA1126]MUV60005.1 hypothetical protein [Halobacterium sp. CBA1126]
MEEKICSAIESETLLKFEYNGHQRTIKPYKLFQSKDGKILIEAVQVGGESESGSNPFWRNFDVAKIDTIETTEGPDSVHNSDLIMPDTEKQYNPDDDRYEEVICAREQPE